MRSNPAWGALYCQYFESLDNISQDNSSIKIKKQLFLQPIDEDQILIPIDSAYRLELGDLVKVRIEFTTDQNMEYVHLKDMRAASFEPITTLSESKYRNGIWYYESSCDLNTNFFFDNLPKGKHVFEYSVRVSQKGNFSNGISTIQCMYAPECSGFSSGQRILVK